MSTVKRPLKSSKNIMWGWVPIKPPDYSKNVLILIFSQTEGEHTKAFHCYLKLPVMLIYYEWVTLYYIAIKNLL